MRIAINGFGRIGRTFLRVLLQDKEARKKIKTAVINVGPAKSEYVAHMFKYDTIMGTFHGDVAMRDNTLIIDDHIIEIEAQTDPSRYNWKRYDIDWVVDASGAYTTREKAQQHIKAGAQFVLITAPATEEDISIIPGVNQQVFDARVHKIVSLGSCTTNAFIPMLKILHDNFGIKSGFMTTVHAYTNSQKLLDVEAKNLRLSRAAALNIIPSSTGASSTVSKILPELSDVVKSSSLRVPVGIVSFIDLTVNLSKVISAQSINETFSTASQSSSLKGIIAITQEPLVSSDFRGNPHSVIIDGLLTETTEACAKVMGWYDNEWGYSHRLKDFLLTI